MEQLKNYKDYCVDYIIDHIGYHIGNDFYDSYELANAITESDNLSGSFTYSTYKAKQYIKHWFDDIADFLNEYEFFYGDNLSVNPFTESEKFHGIMVIVLVENIISNLKYLSNDGFTLTKELADTIIQDIENLMLDQE
jgi:ABC-type tungstate transport system permease subunit